MANMVDIIAISHEANVEAVRRQLAQVRSDHVALELPDGWSGLDNVARMRLLQRQAQIQGCQLALITRHEATCKAARQVGIPVFSGPHEMPKREWTMDPLLPLVDPQKPDAGLPEPPPWRRDEIVKRTARPSLHQARLHRIRMEEVRRRPLPMWLRLIGYVAMGVLLAGVLLFFTIKVLPAATITLVPGQKPVSVTVQFTGDPTLDAPDLEADRLPARLIETTIEETGTIATTGSKQKPVDKATGTVVFNNLGPTPVEIPLGTLVSTGTGTPVNFRTTAPATLEGGVGSRVTVPIEAQEPGIDGNVRANTINTVNGALRFRARVINSGATFGGGSRLVPVVTQQDKDNLLAQMKSAIDAKAFSILTHKLDPGEWLPQQSVQTFTIAQIFDKFNDDEGSQLQLSLRTLIQGTALHEDQTRDAIVAALRRNVPEHALLVADSVTVQRVSDTVNIGRQVQFTMTGKAQYVIPIDPAQVKSTVVGLTPAKAVRAIQQRWPLERTPEIYQDPQWLATLPAFGSRIQVRVQYAESIALPNE